MIIHARLNHQLSSIQQFQVFMLFISVLHNEHINREEWSVHVVKHLSRVALQERGDDDSEMITDFKSDSLLILTCLHKFLEIIHQENVYKVHVWLPTCWTQHMILLWSFEATCCTKLNTVQHVASCMIGFNVFHDRSHAWEQLMWHVHIQPRSHVLSVALLYMHFPLPAIGGSK